MDLSFKDFTSKPSVILFKTRLVRLREHYSLMNIFQRSGLIFVSHIAHPKLLFSIPQNCQLHHLSEQGKYINLSMMKTFITAGRHWGEVAGRGAGICCAPQPPDASRAGLPEHNHPFHHLMASLPLLL